MTDKELAELFEQLEIELISSMNRTLEKHKQWEKSLGFDWTSWQSLKIKSFERFRRECESIMSDYSDIIKTETRKMLEEQFSEGEELEAEQLAEQGFTETSNENFFEIFDEKIESLIEEIHGKETTAEKSALRMMNDVYRQTMIQAEIAVSTGAKTVQQAIDDAVRAFAKQGINSIEYRDGRRVNIADYVYMALRTANTRAGLLGAAKQRMALGIDTVRVTSYNACSETCYPWQGKVYIDDVFASFSGEISGNMGKSNNGKWYLLLSVAIEAGLFHPNCRHSLTSYNEKNSNSPQVDEKKARENYKLEQQQRALERKVRYWKRRAEAENNPEFKELYKKQVRNAQKNLREFIDEHSDVLRRDPWREKIYDMPNVSRKKNVIPLQTDETSGIIKAENAANAPTQNTGRKVAYNPNKNFDISLGGYPDEVNESISKANRKVAELGGKTNTEHLIMVDLNTGNHSYYEDGENEYSVGGKYFWKFVKDNPNGRYAFVHNHNTDGFFSETDIRTLLSCDNIEIFIAVRLDGVSYITVKNKKLIYNSAFDKLYEKELKGINDRVRNGEITAGERTRLREEIIVNNLIKDYTEGLIIFEDGKRLG